MTTKIYDALIIGGGPAGLSVALSLGRVHRTCIVFSNSQFRNAGAEAAHSILTRDHTPPSEIRRLGRLDVERYNNTTFHETTITTVSRTQVGTHTHFLASDATGQQWQGRTLVLATGSRDIFPKDLPGYADNWPSSIYQCMFCDGHERSLTGPSGVLAYPAHSPWDIKFVSMAHFLSRPTGDREPNDKPSNVTFFTNGPLDRSDTAVLSTLEICEAHNITVDERPVLRLSKSTDDDKEGLHVHLQNADKSESQIFQAYLLHKPPTTPSSPDLIQQLGLELTKTPFGENIKVEGLFCAAVGAKGVFVPGDAGSMFAHVTNAMVSGGGVASAVAHLCCEMDDEIAVARLKEKKAGGSGHVEEGGAS